MKKLKYIILFILSIGFFNSCLIDDKTDLNLNSEGESLAGFSTNVIAVAAISDGEEYDFNFKVHLTGPKSLTVSNNIEVTVLAVPLPDTDTSTFAAIEGVHYRIDNPTMTLSADSNHLAELTVTMITKDILTPLEKSPVLTLKISGASGDNNVLANEKTIEITFNYACPSFLAGDYSVETTRGDGGIAHWTETITEIGIGEYVTEYVGTWDPPLNPDWGFVFTDVCDVISVPLQELADMYSNEVWGHAEGEVNPDTGVITILYTIWFAAGNNTYTSVYTPL